MPDKVFLDTNILVYAHDASDPAKRSRSQDLIFDGLRGRSAVLSAQVLNEFLVTVTRKVQPPMSVDHARREIVLLSALEIVALDHTLVLQGIDTQQRYQLNYWDALIIAAADRAGCRTLYSEDFAAGQSYGRVTVHNPY